MKQAQSIEGTISKSVIAILTAIEERERSLSTMIKRQLENMTKGEYRLILSFKTDDEDREFIDVLANLIINDHKTKEYKNDSAEYLPGIMVYICEKNFHNSSEIVLKELFKKMSAFLCMDITLHCIAKGRVQIRVKNIWK